MRSRFICCLQIILVMIIRIVIYFLASLFLSNFILYYSRSAILFSFKNIIDMKSRKKNIKDLFPLKKRDEKMQWCGHELQKHGAKLRACIKAVANTLATGVTVQTG